MRFKNSELGWSRAPVVLGVLALAGLIWACGGTGSVGNRGSGTTSMTKKSNVDHRTTTGSQPMTLARSASTTSSESTSPQDGGSIPYGPPSYFSDSTTEVTSESTIVPPSPEDAKTAWQEGLDLFQSRDYEGAATKFEIVARGREEVVDVHYLLGLSLWNAGRHDEADTAMTRASSLDPDSARIWTNLARIRLDRNDPAGALLAIEQSLATEPDSASALHQKGRALFGLDRGGEAIATLSSARSLEPQNGYIANTLGWVLIQMDRPDEAVGHLEEARDALPTVAFVRNNLGVVYERLGRTESAYEEYRAAVETGDTEGKASVSIARIEPFVERILAQRGEVLPPPATVQGDAPPTPVDTPVSGRETVVLNIPESLENETGGTDDPGTNDDSGTQ